MPDWQLRRVEVVWQSPPIEKLSPAIRKTPSHVDVRTASKKPLITGNGPMNSASAMPAQKSRTHSTIAAIFMAHLLGSVRECSARPPIDVNGTDYFGRLGENSES